MGHTPEQDFVLSGGPGTSVHSARSGYLPVPLRCVPHTALKEIAIYLRNRAEAGTASESAGFTLYRDADVPFTAEDRERLLASGRHFIYVRIADQVRYRAQTERAVADAVEDPRLAVAEKSAIVYETSVELVNELLTEPDLVAYSGRVEGLSRSISTLVLNDPQAFSHLFAASHHDFYTATHMVNVATWIVPLAHALGYRAMDQLLQICQAGLLHDIGKVFVAEEVLNLKGRLSDEQWQLIKQHPIRGWTHLKSFAGIPTLVHDVCRQHHERLDGSGYPDGLAGDAIAHVSRICAVVDSFDAMTALRPFKQRSLAVADAVLELRAGVPHWYDAEIVDAWVQLLRGVHDADFRRPPAGARAVPAPKPEGAERRRNKRYKCDCPARVNPLVRTADGGLHEKPGIQVTIHSLSSFGLGFLSPRALEVSRPVRVYLQAGTWAGRFVHGLVARCRAYRDSWFEIGVELYRDDPDGFEV
jgi:HD-GYP domain-containing protein (c-di-GMP phosphodiesterase class II)